MKVELSAEEVKLALSHYFNGEINRYRDLGTGILEPKDILTVSQKYKIIPRAHPSDYVDVFDGLEIEIKESAD